MRTLAIIPAAGQGSRFGGEIPKQYCELAGKPVLLHVVERFFVDPRIDQIVIAVSQSLLRNLKQAERTRFAAGGATRQDSVMRALEAASDGFDLVAVHDAVRPFYSSQTLHALLDAAAEGGAAIPALAVSDTIHIVEHGLIATTPNRDHLAAAQTPQCFRFEVLRDILERAAREGFEATDEGTLAARYGYPVRVLPGDPLNFKITHPEDLERAEKLLAEIAAS
jgi:2-C-methyl-D-erythritol 4-phosphate cytidylyltransferase